MPVDFLESIRLQAYLARCGIASRRASEKYITSGRVSVNGVAVTQLGTKVSSRDVVCVDGEVITIEQVKRYVLLNKPAGYVCSLSDEKGRPVAVDLLKSAYSERLYNVGRLDMFSTGLIIFTNDGEFAAALSHPSAELEKEYVVRTSTSLPRSLARDFEKGIRIGNIFYRCVRAQEINSHAIRIVLIEGKNREIRNVFAHYETGIKHLKRVRIGNIVADELEEGSFRALSPHEVQGLLALCKSSSIEQF